MKNTIILVILLFLFSCDHAAKKNNQTENVLPVLDMEYVYEHIDKADTSFLWNDIITNERFIPLETTEKCLIGGGSWSAVPFGNDFLVYAPVGLPAPVFQFDSCGRFIRRIAQYGKGPGEMTGFLWNVIPFHNDRYVMIGNSYKTIVKDSDGNLIRDLIDTKFLLRYPYDSGFVYVNQYQRFPNDSTFLCFTDSLGNIVKELKEPSEERISPNESRIIDGLDLREIFFSEGKLWLMKSYNDTLFRITERQSIEPYSVLFRGKYSPVLDKDKKTLHIATYQEVGPYILVATSGIYQIWNRETGEIIAMRKGNNHTAIGSLGNFNYRLPNNHIMQINLMSIKNGKLIFLIKPSMDEHIRAYLHLAEDDNPVLMVADWKEIH